MIFQWQFHAKPSLTYTVHKAPTRRRYRSLTVRAFRHRISRALGLGDDPGCGIQGTPSRILNHRHVSAEQDLADFEHPAVQQARPLAVSQWPGATPKRRRQREGEVGVLMRTLRMTFMAPSMVPCHSSIISSVRFPLTGVPAQHYDTLVRRLRGVLVHFLS